MGGTQGTVVYSLDGGKQWKEIQVPDAEKLDFRDLAILNQKSIILMSAGPAEKGAAKLFISNDQGLNWKVFFEKKIGSYFFDALAWNHSKNEGILLSDPMNGRFPLFRIYPKDELVKDVILTSFPKLLTREAAFAASGSSLLWMNNHLILVTGGASKARIIQSTDKQLSQFIERYQATPADSSSGFFSIAARDKKNYWVVGGNYLKTQENKIGILETKDSGKTWQVLENTPNFYMEKVIWTGKYWVMVGPFASAAYNPKTKKWISLGESHFHNVTKFGEYLFAVGSKGNLAKLSLKVLEQLFLSKE